MPDPTLHPVGRAGADTVGPMQLNLLVHFGLTPDDRVLDLGCGIGRLAYTMADYLSTGYYDGLDVSKKAIQWLEENYTTVLPNFHFGVLDVWNPRYNPKGTLTPSEVVLPYESSFFDRLGAFSLFTHMQPEDTAAYLGEIRRVLKPDGLAVVTFFSIDPEVDTDPHYGNQPFLRVSGRENVWTLNPELPERGIALDSRLIDQMVGDAGLRTDQRIAGYWRGRRRTEPPYKWAHQDVYALARLS